MNDFQRNIFRTTNEVIQSNLEEGSISSTNQTAPDNACALLLDSVCYIDTVTNGAITSGDIVYNDIGGSNPIIGGNQYYKISLINVYTVLISDGGVMNVVSICA
jgi:hypothetical protein